MTPKQTRPSRWDPAVKLTHWSLVLAVLVNAIITEEGSGADIWVGYALSAILALRLLWGLIGPSEARFSAFLPSPQRALTHIREISNGVKSEHKSHNPLGALMVYAMWTCLFTIIVTGISMAGLPSSAERPTESLVVSSLNGKQVQMTEVTEGHGGEELEEVEKDEEGLAGEIHEIAANLLYFLILLHLAGVLFETRRRGYKVILAMVPGHR